MICMHSKFGQRMPVTAYEKQPQNDRIVWFRKEAIKYRNSTLTLIVKCSIHKEKEHTWSRSAKSRAAIFFISDELFENLLIVSRPNVGTCRYLDHLALDSNRCKKQCYAPTIHLIKQCFISGIKNAEQVTEQGFPNAEFEFVHKIDDQHGECIQSKLR